MARPVLGAGRGASAAGRPCSTCSLSVGCVVCCAAGAAGGGLEHAVAINNIDVASEYIQKLRQELDGHAGGVTQLMALAQSKLTCMYPCMVSFSSMGCKPWLCPQKAGGAASSVTWPARAVKVVCAVSYVSRRHAIPGITY